MIVMDGKFIFLSSVATDKQPEWNSLLVFFFVCLFCFLFFKKDMKELQCLTWAVKAVGLRL